MWLGLTKTSNQKFSTSVDAELYLQYTDNSPYAHIPGVTYDMNKEDELCIYAKIESSTQSLSKWYDGDCDKSYGFICEYECNF